MIELEHTFMMIKKTARKMGRFFLPENDQRLAFSFQPFSLADLVMHPEHHRRRNEE